MVDLRKRREQLLAGASKKKEEALDKTEIGTKRASPSESSTQPTKRAKISDLSQDDTDDGSVANRTNLRDRLLAAPSSLKHAQSSEDAAQYDFPPAPSRGYTGTPPNQRLHQLARSTTSFASINRGTRFTPINGTNCAEAEVAESVTEDEVFYETTEFEEQPGLVKNEDGNTEGSSNRTRLTPPSSHRASADGNDSGKPASMGESKHDNEHQAQQEPNMNKRKRDQEFTKDGDIEGSAAKRAKNNEASKNDFSGMATPSDKNDEAQKQPKLDKRKRGDYTAEDDDDESVAAKRPKQHHENFENGVPVIENHDLDFTFTFDSARSIRSTSEESTAHTQNLVENAPPASDVPEEDNEPPPPVTNGNKVGNAATKRATKKKVLIRYETDQENGENEESDQFTPSDQTNATDSADLHPKASKSMPATEAPTVADADDAAGEDINTEQQSVVETLEVFDDKVDEIEETEVLDEIQVIEEIEVVEQMEEEEEDQDIQPTKRLANAIRNFQPAEHACWAPVLRQPKLGLVVKGVGLIDFPPTISQAESLIKAAYKLRVEGLGVLWTVSNVITEDEEGRSHRPTWMLPPSELKFTDRRWESFVQETAATAARRLGFGHLNIETKLYGMFVWEPNSVWRSYVNVRPHKKRLATLFISLPSPHTGGTIVIGSAGNEYRFRTDEWPMCWIAAHQVANYDPFPVDRGLRMGMVYELYNDDCTDAVHENYNRIAASAQAEKKLFDSVRGWIDSVIEGDIEDYPLLMPLQGQYRADALALDQLNPADGSVARAVHTMAKALQEEELMDVLEPEVQSEPAASGKGGRKKGKKEKAKPRFILNVYLAWVTRRQRLYGAAAGGRQAGRYSITRAVTFEGASKPRVANIAIEERNVLDPAAFDGRANETAVTETMGNATSEATCLMMVLTRQK